MAHGDTLQGRRLTDEEVERDGMFAALDAAGAGAYYGPKVGYTADRPAVFYLLPNARDEDADARMRSIGHVTTPPHTFTEEDDGSLTIAASILHRAPGDGDAGWHGYLEHGVWREA